MGTFFLGGRNFELDDGGQGGSTVLATRLTYGIIFLLEPSNVSNHVSS
jgi:hypothetical protein